MSIIDDDHDTGSTPAAATPPQARGAGRSRSGLNFFVARTLDDVLEAWGVVYYAYLRAGLIDSNPFEVHTVPQAIGPQTLVVTGCLGPLSVSTLSAYVDNPSGVPLDAVYRAELDGLRLEGRRIMEVGLFADRRDHIARTAQGLLELMRFSFYYAIHSKCDDVVIGVHPEHAPFYRRIFGFEAIGEVRRYPIVKDNPATLLRFNLRDRTQLDPLPRGLWFFAQNELGEQVFAQRYLFDDPGLPSSLVGRFLAYKRAMARAAA